MKYNLCLLVLTTIVLSCSIVDQEFFIIGEINVFNNFQENEQLAKDLVSYDYYDMLNQKLEIDNYNVLSNITYQYFIKEDTKEITFRLTLNNEAKDMKDKIVPFFEEIVSTKVKDYKDKKLEFNMAVEKALEVTNLYDDMNSDLLWNQTSEKVKQLTVKSELVKSISGRQNDFEVGGVRTLINRQVCYDIGNGMIGEFYTISFECEKKIIEQITLENVKDSMMFVEYRYFIPNKPPQMQ